MKSHVISVIQISQTQILQLTFMAFDESLSNDFIKYARS